MTEEKWKGNIGDSVSSTNDKTEPDLETVVTNELERLGSGGIWIWKLFFLCLIPNIVNGFHISSYVFLGCMPNEYWCGIPELMKTNWTKDQMMNIAAVDSDLHGCKIYNYDYSYLSTMDYNEAMLYTEANARPDDLSCLTNDGTYMQYELNGSSIVPEWDLVCENTAWRTIVQVAISVGKGIGAVPFGVIADKYGRKTSFIAGSVVFILGSIFATATPWYWLFLIGRILLGMSTTGLFYPVLPLLAENMSARHRTYMVIFVSTCFPLGMLYLALAANFLDYWRDLQLALSIPGVVLFFYWFFFKESPRWLINKGKLGEAYKLLFNKKTNIEIPINPKSPHDTRETNLRISLRNKFGTIFKEITSLYGPSKQRRIALVSHYIFFTCALSYNVTAINADNLSASRVIYVTATGCVDVIGYCIATICLRYMGRRVSTCLIFSCTALCLLLILAVPIDLTSWIVTLAMFGRSGVTSVYSIVLLQVTELFPTEIRASAMGANATVSQIAAITAPFVVDFLGQLGWFIPTTICGSAVLLAALLSLTHPETSHIHLAKVDHSQ